MWWDINKTLSYNRLFNFIVGNRGAGKTYGAKKYVISQFLKHNAQFIYVRRYKQELKKNSKFFNDVMGEFPKCKFSVEGMDLLIDKKIAGTSIPLSTAKIEKSTPFPDVETIIFDEFLIDKGTYHYLPDEVVAFLELYETIARMRNVRVLFLSNALTVTNPYFIYFDLELPRGEKKIITKGDLLLELVQENDFIEAKKQTRFGKLIAGTEYAKYSIDNQFLRDNKTFLEKKTGTSHYYFTIKFEGKLFGVWIDYNAGKIFVSEDIDPSCRFIYSLTLNDHSPNTLLIKQLSKVPYFRNFIDNYKMGNVYFENINVKNITYKIIRMTIQ